MIVNLAAIALGLFIGWTAAHVSKELKHSSSMVAAYRAGMAQRHDEIVAAISHVPHASASALMLAVGSLPGFDPATTGAGLKDTTRIAAGEENLWVGILMANAPHVIAGLRAAEDQTANLRQALEAGDAEKVRQLLADARVLRQSLDRPA